MNPHKAANRKQQLKYRLFQTCMWDPKFLRHMIPLYVYLWNTYVVWHTPGIPVTIPAVRLVSRLSYDISGLSVEHVPRSNRPLVF